MEGEITSELVQYLKEKYGDVDVIENEDEEWVQITRSDWYRNIRTQISPGENMSIYRKLHGLSQEKLGKKLGSGVIAQSARLRLKSSQSFLMFQ